MPAIRNGVNGLLSEFATLVPVDKELKPSLFDFLSSTLQPTIGFNPAPLAAQTLRVEMFALSVTLVGAQDTIVYTSGAAVPNGEVHRYLNIGFSHTLGGNKLISLITRYQLFGVAAVFTSDVSVRRTLGPGIRTNMLSHGENTNTNDVNWVGTPYDLYPGGSWQIGNDVGSPLDLLSVTSLQGVRFVLRGPDVNAPVDRSVDFTGVAS